MKPKILKEIELHLKLVEDFKNSEIDKIIEISKAIVSSLKSGGSIYLCGNGGSAADAQHIAGELMGKFRLNSKPFPAISLSTDTSVMTCIGNDYSFDNIFSRQVRALIKKNDLLWVFTTSGKSQNIIKACKEAKNCGGKVIAFTGRTETNFKEIADLIFKVDSEITSTVQEMHQLGYHIICGIVERELTQE